MRLVILASVALWSGHAQAERPEPRTDLEIVAVDAKSGEIKWSHATTPLGYADFELYPAVLVAYRRQGVVDDHTLDEIEDGPTRIFVDPKTGALTKTRPDLSERRARSFKAHDREPLTLANGWRYEHFGFHPKLEFTAPASDAIVWSVPLSHYPSTGFAYRNTVIFADRYKATIHAYRAGADRPTWTIDFNKLLKTNRDTHIRHITMYWRGDLVFAQTRTRVFAIRPETGKLAWQIDVARTTGMPPSAFYDDTGAAFHGDGDVLSSDAVFNADDGVLVVAYLQHVVAFRATTGSLLWHRGPDTDPHHSRPIIKDGVMYMTMGPRRTKLMHAPR